MAYSKGGRGVSKHIWGTRKYEVVKDERRLPRLHGTTTVHLITHEREDGTYELSVKCDNCGAVNYAKWWKQDGPCMLCGLQQVKIAYKD